MKHFGAEYLESSDGLVVAGSPWKWMDMYGVTHEYINGAWIEYME